MAIKLFNEHSKEEHAMSLSHFMPNGRIFAKKWVSGSILFKYIMGLACELFRIEEQMNLISFEHDINVTTQFIDEWESAVGIPDACLSGTGPLENRRRDVLVKLAMMNVTTAQDFIDLANEFGVVVTITPGAIPGAFPMVFPLVFFPTGKTARFTMIVDFTTTLEVFPLTFPIPFGDGAIGIVKCLFNRIRPANVQLLYTS